MLHLNNVYVRVDNTWHTMRDGIDITEREIS